jgi:hypothetical protein
VLLPVEGRGQVAMMRTAILGIALLLLGGCTDTGTREVATSASPSPSSPTARTSAPVVCPNTLEDGGSCLGPLDAGTSYTTQRFDPAITYSVSASGWNNYEDLYGNFLLVAPDQPLEGVNANTADFIGVFRGLTPSRTLGPQCHEESSLEPGENPTVRRMWAIYAADPLLKVTPPKPVSIGGLRGLVGDIELRPGAKLPRCQDGEKVIRPAGLFSGTEGSEVAHSMVPGVTMRLYLLEDQGRVLGIEVSDVADAPASLDELTAVAESLQFAR